MHESQNLPVTIEILHCHMEVYTIHINTLIWIPWNLEPNKWDFLLDNLRQYFSIPIKYIVYLYMYLCIYAMPVEHKTTINFHTWWWMDEGDGMARGKDKNTAEAEGNFLCQITGTNCGNWHKNVKRTI